MNIQNGYTELYTRFQLECVHFPKLEIQAIALDYDGGSQDFAVGIYRRGPEAFEDRLQCILETNGDLSYVAYDEDYNRILQTVTVKGGIDTMMRGCTELLDRLNKSIV